MDYPSKNIFNLVDPQRYECNIWSFRVNHRVLLIRADKDKFNNQTCYLSFTEVLYFEGPLNWIGADFCIGKADECIKLLGRRGFKDIPKDELLDKFGLFTVQLPNSEVVKILASKHAEKTSDIPPDFPWLVEPSTG
jgi:hypothetical protein